MAIFRYELRQLRARTFWWSVGVALLIAWMFPLYNDMVSGGGQLSMMAGNGLFELLEVDMDVLQTPIGVFGFLSSFFVIAAGINGMYLGLSAFSKEVIGRSAEFLYTKPFRRGRVFCAKLLAALCSVLITGACYGLGALACTAMVPAGGFDGCLPLVALSFLWVELFFLLLGALVGAAHPKVRTPLLLSSGVVFVFYVFSAFASKVGNAMIKYFTPFSYFSVGKIVNAGGYDAGYMLVFALLCAGFAALGYRAFVRNDVTFVS